MHVEIAADLLERDGLGQPPVGRGIDFLAGFPHLGRDERQPERLVDVDFRRGRHKADAVAKPIPPEAESAIGGTHRESFHVRGRTGEPHERVRPPVGRDQADRDVGPIEPEHDGARTGVERHHVGREPGQPDRRAGGVPRREQQPERADERIVASRATGRRTLLQLRARRLDCRDERVNHRPRTAERQLRAFRA